MAPFSVAQLKEKASSVKSSSSEKFQSVRGKYTSRSSAESSYDPRIPSTKAPPPPPHPLQRASYDDRQNAVVAPPPKRSGPPPPIRRQTRPDSQTPRLTRQEQAPEGIKWSSLNPEDKKVFFGWLDEFFSTKGYAAGSGANHNRNADNSKTMDANKNTDTLKMSHPPHSEHGSAAQDLCVFFSPATHWATPWFSSQSPTPPPLEHVTDCMRTYSIQSFNDNRTLSGGVLFGDLSLCWYIVDWSVQTVHDTMKARRSAASFPRPNAMCMEDLVVAHETYGETIAAFAEGYEGTGQWCARGECWDLASEALKAFQQWDYIPNPLPSIGKTHGHLIYEGRAWGKNSAIEQAGRWRGGDDRIRRGDIVQWKSAAITEGRSRFTLGDPDHTAIIVNDQKPLRIPGNDEAMRPADLGALEVVEQSVHSPPSRKIYKLSGLEAGELWIYRPIGMEAYLKVIFSEKWPEGLQAAASTDL